MDNGVPLRSTAHPRSPWYKRLWHWLQWGSPSIGEDALETVEIEITRAENGFLNGTLGAWLTQRTTSMNDNEVEKEIQAKGLTAPRVTLAQIESAIAYELYVTGDQLPAITTPVLGIANAQVPTLVDTTSLACLTLCVLVLRNGFTVTGESACASPDNFDAALGRKIARQKAIDKVWMLEGYLLKEKLHREATEHTYGPGRTKEGY